MMKPILLEAIVLQAFPFKEYDRLLTLFSPQGICKLFVKGTKKDYLHLVALTSPLTHAEFYYTQGRRDLHRFVEGAILNQNLHIRACYDTLVAAEKMIQALLKSQWPGKPAPKLFHLFSLLIAHFPKGSPANIYTIFLLKILRHEGLLELSSPIQASYRFAGEKFSQKEAPFGALFFTDEEEQLLTECALGRSLACREQNMPKAFTDKIETLFFQTFI